MGGLGNISIYLGMPNDRVFVVLYGNMATDSIEKMLGADGSKPAISGDTLNSVRGLEKSAAWFLVQLDPKITQSLPLLLGMVAGKAPPELKPAIDAAGNTQALSGSLSFGDPVQLNLTVTMSNANAANDVARGLNDAWQKKGKTQWTAMKALMNLAGKNDLDGFFDDVTKSLQVRAEGTSAKASVSVSKQSLQKAKDFAEKAKNQQMGGGPMGGPRRGGINPGGQLPPR
jgi:hypothetical protein